MGSRSDFNDTWLFEMPSGVGSFETYDALIYNIRDMLKHGFKSEKINTNLNKLVSGDVIFYWYGTDSDIELGTELHKKPEGLIVSITGKNPKLRGDKPYASDLYSAILKDTDKSIRLHSDKQLSDEGFNIWKKLLSLGHKISVYDVHNPGKTLTSFHSAAEMDKFFKHDDTNFERYQYVLSESLLKLGEVRAKFNTRRHREIAGLNLID